MPNQHQKEIEFLSGQGNLLISEIDELTGLPIGYRLFANVSELTLSHNVDTTNFNESTSGQRSIVLRHETGKEILVKFKFQSFSKENVQLAIYGSAVSDGAAIVGAEKVFNAQLGLITALGKAATSNMVLTDDASGLITYVEGHNYKYDDVAGSIEILTAAEQLVSNAGNSAANLIIQNLVLKATFDHASNTKISAFTEARKNVALRFEGLNTEDSDNPVVLEIHKFNTDPLAEMAMISTEIWEGDLEGTALFDPTKLVGSKFYDIYTAKVA